ncbi:hypothetical protein B7494_g6737 [Chlorociboria aeruginascens]|nr:hypothetical protein B7494_g6737 [Chlorociboria aeruginascens]
MEDFNLPSEERVILLRQFRTKIEKVPPHFWAACQLCDLASLEKLVKCSHDYPQVLFAFVEQTETVIQHWSQHPPKGKASSRVSTPQNQTPSLDSDSSPHSPSAKRQKMSDSPTLTYRNKKARGLAYQRDNRRCVLTGNVLAEVAHIYPFHSLKYKEENIFGRRHMLWNLLRGFWSEEKVTAWEKELFPEGISEVSRDQVYNLMTLSADAHKEWGQGAFALKPISLSEDKKTLEVQFFWQKKQRDIQETMDLLTVPHSTEGLDSNIGMIDSGEPVELVKKQQQQRVPIKSGDCFKLQTDDPDTKPLPSFELLELQWFLQRIQGMAGAAEVEWPTISDPGSDEEMVFENMRATEDMDEMPDLVLDEVGEESFDSLSSPEKFLHNNKSSSSVHPKRFTEEAEGDEERVEREHRQVAM